jgi:hypothetical protein
MCVMCAASKHKCLATTGVCTNTAGSYSCACATGYTGDGKKSCIDINECTLTSFSPLWSVNVGGVNIYRGASICKANANQKGRVVCTNTVGSYSCTCPVGTYDNSAGGVAGKCLTAFINIKQCQARSCAANSSCSAVTAVGGTSRFACKCTGANVAIDAGGACTARRLLRAGQDFSSGAAEEGCEGDSCTLANQEGSD